jgi:ABC-type multidrug transport system fused ATPase/permease subunit
MFSRLIVSLNKAAASNKRINAFYAFEPSIVNMKKYEKSDEIAGAPIVRFDDVSLTYGKEGEKPAVSNLSFSVPKGAWVGLIGGTGSGKSSTISLLERLYEPSSGTIYYRGVPLDQYDLDSLRKEISLVSQRPSLFKGTIRSNLLLGKGNASEEEMVTALKGSLAYEYVAQYSDFLDHQIEEAGANLSGGQKQRLLIARALLKGGDLLILDDATSALDYLSDQKVRENISAIPGLTKIIVSQRAGSLKECDLILVYGNGCIIAQGNHEELLISCPVYKDIYDMQKGEAA